jgi:hypothetical protein
MVGRAPASIFCWRHYAKRLLLLCRPLLFRTGRGEEYLAVHSLPVKQAPGIGINARAACSSAVSQANRS